MPKILKIFSPFDAPMDYLGLPISPVNPKLNPCLSLRSTILAGYKDFYRILDIGGFHSPKKKHKEN